MKDEVQSAQTVKGLLQAIVDSGFSFTYFYQKGGDSSCVYIYRFQKGKDYFDWRETSGKLELHFVVYVNGEYRFPVLYTLYKKQRRKFAFSHLFKRATVDEERAFFASLIMAEWDKAQPQKDFFGIAL